MQITIAVTTTIAMAGLSIGAPTTEVTPVITDAPTTNAVVTIQEDDPTTNLSDRTKHYPGDLTSRTYKPSSTIASPIIKTPAPLPRNLQPPTI